MKVRYFDKRGTCWIDFKDATGERRRVPSGYVTEAEAKANIVKVLAGYIGTSLPSTKAPTMGTHEPVGITLQQAYDRAMREHDGWIGSKDKTTLGHTFKALKAYWGADRALARANREAVLLWREAMLKEPGKRKDSTLSNSTINHRLSMLSVMLEVCQLPPHTVKHLSTKQSRRERRITDTEIKAMKAWLIANSQRHRGAESMCQLITMGLETGARLSELLDLKWSDVGEGSVTFRETKNSRDRTVPLTPDAALVLEARSGFKERPFPDLDQFRAVDLWALARNGIGLSEDFNFVFHGLRHECISRLSDEGGNASVIQAIAGHESITTTQRYAHASFGAMQKAMGIKGNIAQVG